MARFFWKQTRPHQRFVSEAVEPGAELSRRGILAGACACCAAFAAGTTGSIGQALAQAPGLQPAPARPIHARLDQAAAAIEERMIAWRRDIHANPELGNQEVRTAGLVAKHLKSLGYEVREGVAKTGIVALLRGGGDGPVVALRADMDALPVTEEVDLPFASKARAQSGGEEVGVMHACGHDCHVAILMAVAEVLAGMKGELRGSIKLLFQPAEEGLTNFEVGGARVMVEQGAMANPKPDVVFGLHVSSAAPVGVIGYRAGPTMASSDSFRIRVSGRQTHGAIPWGGVDPIVIGAAIVSSLQTVVSRETNIFTDPAVLTVGVFKGGVRRNIISDRAEMEGTLRTFNAEQRLTIMRRVKEVAEHTAEGMRGKAEVIWDPTGYPPLINNVALTQASAPTLARVTGGKAVQVERVSASEDFPFFADVSPGFFFFVGVTGPGVPQGQAPPNHSPRFRVDERGLIIGLRAMLHLVADYTKMDV
ncbi:amidohydrolase [Phreatobacter stygius]|uniref:Amidohydrolase n=1 Tax=Phreatobacter stygius TaxID=1940610 RepID=A0A4D7B7U6_9HYPH|nr:amidohydrolase [Phreatobacter stygius]QCI66398.1 amidohydrolase [Phreatobacter stygius]